MTIRAAVATLLAAAFLPAVGLAAEITVYEDWDYRGASTVFDGAVSRIEGSWNDRVSSFRVNSGTWEICRDWDYRNCRIVGPGTEETRLGSGENDTMSSLRPVGDSAAVDPQTVAARLYRGLLGREPDPEGLRNATAKIAAGSLTSVVDSITASDEFRNIRSQRSASDLLDQIYRGLLGRAADTAARTAYLGRIEDGDVTDVVVDLVASEEFAGAGSTAVAAATDTATGEERRTRGRGEGVMIRGPRDRVDTINSVKVLLGGDGRFRLTFAGSTPHQLEGTYTRESADFARINTIDTESGTLPAEGGITLNNEWLERLDLEAGTPGAQNHVIYNFVAETFALSQEETSCQEAVRARLQQDRGGNVKLAFVSQQQSRINSQRQELRGKAVVLADNSTVEYRCQIDRSGQVLNASVQ
jgi:hypothetical protein